MRIAPTRVVHSCWVTFAKTGTPMCEGAPDWPLYTPQTDQLMELGLKPEVRTHFRQRQLDAQEAAWRDGIEHATKAVEDALRKMEKTQLRPSRQISD